MATRPPAIGVRIVPSRVRAGRRSRVRVRLHAIAPRCVRGATVQLNRARTRSDAHGRATLVARLPRAGIYPVTATKRGCQAGRASVIATGR